MIYRSKWHEVDGETIVTILVFIIIFLVNISGLILLLKEQDYKHEVELKKIELCGEDDGQV